MPMKRLVTILLVVIVGVMFVSACSNFSMAASLTNTKGIIAAELSCEYLKNPLGLDTVEPRFSWILESNQRGQMQSAYEILVATTAEKLDKNIGDKWDSGKVASGQSVNIAYQGKALSSGEKCFWKVRSWNKKGKCSPWSTSATFEMGLL
jgi:alpha-L-rhamnosidase